jgi:peptidoglycan biosynthesis protein MviN/MurJ (putative lipid II flippase)
MRVYIIGTVCLVVELGSIVLLMKQGTFALRVNLVLLTVSVALSYLGALYAGLPGAATGSVLAIYLDRVITLRRVSQQTGVPFMQVQRWKRLFLTAAIAALCGALAWFTVELLLHHAGPFRRLMLGAAVLGLAYLPWLIVNARNHE